MSSRFSVVDCVWSLSTNVPICIGFRRFIKAAHFQGELVFSRNSHAKRGGNLSQMFYFFEWNTTFSLGSFSPITTSFSVSCPASRKTKVTKISKISLLGLFWYRIVPKLMTRAPLKALNQSGRVKSQFPLRLSSSIADGFRRIQYRRNAARRSVKISPLCAAAASSISDIMPPLAMLGPRRAAL